MISMNEVKSDLALGPVRSAIAVADLTDAELESRLKRLAGIERKALVLLLGHLGEFDKRRIHAERGHQSLFAHCLSVLGYSEQAAYKRIQAARAARDHPAVLERLAGGELNLTAVVILAPHLRADNIAALLDAARGRRTREIEALVARLAPRPDSNDLLRAIPANLENAAPTEILRFPVISPLPETARPPESGVTVGRAKSAASGGVPSPYTVGERIEQLSPERHLFRFTGSSGLRTKYERARALLAGARGRGSMEAVVEAGMDALLDRVDPERRIARRKARRAKRMIPSRSGRWISVSLRDAIWERDGGRCTFTAPDGVRCAATSRLEIDHVRPYALGGSSDDAANLRLMCRTHNQLLARRVFGTAAGPRARNADYP